MHLLYLQHNHHHVSLHLKAKINVARYETPRTVENHRAGYYINIQVGSKDKHFTCNNYIIPTFDSVPIPIARLQCQHGRPQRRLCVTCKDCNNRLENAPFKEGIGTH